MNKIFLFACFIFLSFRSYSQQFIWAKQLGGIGADVGYFVCYDHDGNIYTMGTFNDTADFDPGPNVFQLIPVSGDDLFITKVDAAGDFIWAVSFDVRNPNYCWSRSMVCDGQGNICFTGTFMGTVDFDPGQGVFNLSAPSIETYICKLDSSGNFLWVKQFDAGVTLKSLALDQNDNLICCGAIVGITDVDPDTSTYILYPTAHDILGLKLSPSGSFLWAITCPGITTADGLQILLDAQNNIYISGFFYDTVDFDPGPGTYFMYTGGYANGQGNDFILKLNSSGTFTWCKPIISSGVSNHTMIMAFDKDNFGNLLLAGYVYGGPVFFDNIPLTSNGSFDMFIAKMNSQGIFQWAENIGAEDEDQVSSLAADDLGNVFVIGGFQDTVDFDPGPGVYNLNSGNVSGKIPCIFSLDPSGNFLWAQANPTVNSNSSQILCDESNQIFIVGSFRNTVNFDGQGTYMMTSFTATKTDVFILKLGNTLDVNSTKMNDRIKLYPNPANTFVTIESSTNEMTSLEIFNLTGEKIYPDQSSFNFTSAHVSLENWNPGIYFVKATTDKSVVIDKLIIQ